jgi:hypothetical protein
MLLLYSFLECTVGEEPTLNPAREAAYWARERTK